MKIKSIEKIIKAEIERSTPKKSKVIIEQSIQIKENKPFFKKPIFYSIISLCVALCITLIPIFNSLSTKENGFVLSKEGTIIIDINPSIEFAFDKKGIITEEIGLNADGRLLLVNNNYLNKHYKIVVQELVEDCKQLGYFSSSYKTNAILISAMDKKGEPYKDFNKDLTKHFQENFNSNGLNGEIILGPELPVEPKHGLTVQKTYLVEQVLELSNGLFNFEDLKDKSISELYQYQEEFKTENLISSIKEQVVQIKNLVNQNKQELQQKISSNVELNEAQLSGLFDRFNFLTNDILIVANYNKEELQSNEMFIKKVFSDLLFNELCEIINSNQDIYDFLQNQLNEDTTLKKVFYNVCKFFVAWKTEYCPNEIIDYRKEKFSGEKGEHQHDPNNKPPHHSGENHPPNSPPPRPIPNTN